MDLEAMVDVLETVRLKAFKLDRSSDQLCKLCLEAGHLCYYSYKSKKHWECPDCGFSPISNLPEEQEEKE